MSQKNGILSIICAQRQRNHEFSEVAKALIVQAVEGGRSYRDVAAEAGCSPAAIFNIFQRWKTHQTLDKKSRSGRPRKLTVQQIRLEGRYRRIAGDHFQRRIISSIATQL
ncbi:hypothetical protein Forpe1208_v016186 [Fusarium oxysporum f. sp. rapae]|uniref:Transposase n=1 Tax=Fusarium oxysporum f. sp. rapae TaxID=485398 RepID=A0A8J5NGM0_FUSOX|nr:hypothetical protein Forpe1208_v016186 [Fusarium oxysporum f. sp. rapae]